MASDNVIKVRLTAEGIQDVVNGLKKVQSETSAAARAGKAAGDALGALGTLFAAQRLAAFASDAIQVADGLFKMSQKTGSAVESLSVLTHMAQLADLSNEDLEKGLVKLAKSLVALEQGDKPAVESFKRLGLTAADFKGLSLDQALLKVANAQARFADGAGKAATATEIFGKSGANMIPLLNDMAGGGLEQTRDKLQKLGVILSGDLARGAQDFNDRLKELELAAKGVTVQMAGSLLPGLTHGISALTAALAGLPAGTKAFAGSFLAIGTAATSAAVAVRMLYTTIAGLGPIGLAVVALSAAVAGIAAMKAAEEAAQAEAIRTNAEMRERVHTGRNLVDAYTREAAALESHNLPAKERRQHEEALKKLEEELIKLSPAYKDALDKGTTSVKARADALRQANEYERENLQLKRKNLEAEMAQLQATIDATEVDVRRREEEGKTSAGGAMGISGSGGFGYLQGLKNQLAALKAKRDALTAAPPPPGSAGTDKPTVPIEPGADKKTAAEALRKAQLAEDLASAKRKYEIRKQGLDGMETLTENAYKDGLVSLEDYLNARAFLVAQGAKAEVELLKKQIAAEEEARAKAETDAERQAADTKIADLQTQIRIKRGEADAKQAALDHQAPQLAMEAASKGQSRAEAQMNLDLGAVDTAVAMGQISSDEAIQRKIALYQQWIPVLRSAAEEQLRLAQAENDGQGNPDDILKAEENIAKVNALDGTLHQLGESLQWVKNTAKEAIAGGLEEFLMNLGDQTTSLADKFRALGASIAQALARAAAQKMVTSMMGAMGFSEGGAVFGAGTATSDSIPAYLSDGEYVIRAAAVKRVGYGLLDAINGLQFQRGSFPRFAEGGAVPRVEAPVVRGDFTHTIGISLDPHLIADFLKSPEGTRIMAQQVAANPKRFNSALGRRF